MPPKSNNDARALLVLSSLSANGDADGPPTLGHAFDDTLGVVRDLRDEGAWPDGTDVLVLSDSYGLVEPLDEGISPVPAPFARAQNEEWWAGFISRNLDNYISRKGHTRALVMALPWHERALRLTTRLAEIETEWSEEGPDPRAQLVAWLGSGAKKRRARRSAAAAVSGANGHAPTTPPSLSIVPPESPEPRRLTRAARRSPAPSVDSPAFARDVIDESVYSSRGMIVLSKLSGEEMRAVRDGLYAVWSRRREQRERRAVSNLVVKSARLPWSERPAATLCTRLFDNIGMATLLGSINKAVAQLALTEEGRYRDILARMPRDESEFMAGLLYTLWEASARMDKDEIAILRAYLTAECTPEELRRLNLARNLPVEDRYELLRAVVGSFTGLSRTESISDHRRVWLILDEAENILGYSPADRWQVAKALETVAGGAPPYLTLWLNISPHAAATSRDIQAALENNLVITHDLTGAER